MPGRNTPANWKPRTIALLRRAVECGGVNRAAGLIGEKREQLIEDAVRLAERTAEELMSSGAYVSYNESCRVAADRLEAK